MSEIEDTPLIGERPCIRCKQYECICEPLTTQPTQEKEGI